MADAKTSSLTSVSTPAGTETFALVQSSATVKGVLGDINALKLLSGPTSLSGATVSLTSISQKFSDLFLRLKGASLSTTGTIGLALSGDNGSTWTSAVAITTSGAGTVVYSGLTWIPGYKLGAGVIRASASGTLGTTDKSLLIPTVGALQWRVDAGINAIRLSASAGTFDAGTVEFYGR